MQKYKKKKNQELNLNPIKAQECVEPKEIESILKTTGYTKQ